MSARLMLLPTYIIIQQTNFRNQILSRTRNCPPRETSLFSTDLSIGSTADLFSSATLAALAAGSSSKCVLIVTPITTSIASTISSTWALSKLFLPFNPNCAARNLVIAIDWAISSPSHSSRGHCPYGVLGLRAAHGFGLSHGAGRRT